MRRRATTLALVTAAALATGCTTEVRGTAVLSDEERREVFCSDVPVLLQDITVQLEDVVTDPTSAPGVLDDAVSRMEAVRSPDDVADEWERLVAVWRDLRDLIAQVDLDDPGANGEFADDLRELQPELVDAGTAIDEWGQANC